MNTLVISNIHREPKILPYLEGSNPIRSLSADIPFCCIGQMRCYHGHLIALKCYMTDETAMVFEDDAVPFDGVDWKGSIEAANKMVLEKGYDIVCFSGRGFDFSKFDKISEYKVGSVVFLKCSSTYFLILGPMGSSNDLD